MDDLTKDQRVLAQESMERFWETFPVVWNQARGFMHQASSRENLTFSGFSIMRGIRRGRNTVSQIADGGHLSRPTISRGVDNLVEKGLVARSPDLDDRRIIKLALTEQGERLLDRVKQATQEWMLEKLAALESTQLQSVLEGLELLKSAFEENNQGR